MFCFIILAKSKWLFLKMQIIWLFCSYNATPYHHGFPAKLRGWFNNFSVQTELLRIICHSQAYYCEKSKRSCCCIFHFGTSPRDASGIFLFQEKHNIFIFSKLLLNFKFIFNFLLRGVSLKASFCFIG